MTFILFCCKTSFISRCGRSRLSVFKSAVFFIVGTSFCLVFMGVYDNFWTALRYASFNIISITTSTGLTSVNYLAWGMLFQTLFVIFALTGGLRGSTAGSVKIFRWQVVWAYLKQSMITAVDPNRVVPVKSQTVYDRSRNYFVGFGCDSRFRGDYGGKRCCWRFTGLDFATAFSAAVATVTNSGLRNCRLDRAGRKLCASLSVVAKYALMAAMLLGPFGSFDGVGCIYQNFWRK